MRTIMGGITVTAAVVKAFDTVYYTVVRDGQATVFTDCKSVKAGK